MKSYLTSRDRKAVVAALAVALPCAWILYRAGGLIVVLVAIAILIVILQIELYRRTLHSFAAQEASARQSQLQDYAQIEALFSTFGLIQLNAPLPPLRGWAVSPDFVNLMIGVLRERKPELTVELGSGVSTLIAGYVVKSWGGRVVSFEHLEEFASASREQIRMHQLEDSVTVCCAPLKQLTLKGQSYLWYDTSKLGGNTTIGVLVVDGPPGQLQRFSRYPAVPILRDLLSTRSVILLDDAAREDERKILELWQAELDGVQCDFVNVEKGAAILRWPSSALVPEHR
jgi:predicted O-methyltransferase YrrM